MNGADHGPAKRASEICGCPEGKVGYFLHGHCACSGDPISLSNEYEVDMESDVKRSVTSKPDPEPTGDCPACYNRELPFRYLDGRCTCIHVKEDRAYKSRGICPHCPRSSPSSKDSSGHCQCPQFDRKREASVKSAGTFQKDGELEARKAICAINCRYLSRPVRGEDGKCHCEPVETDVLKKRQSPDAMVKMIVHSPPLFKIYYDGNHQQAKLDCLVYMQCQAGVAPPAADYRGVVTPHGECICKPKQTGRDLSLTDKVLDKRGQIDSGAENQCLLHECQPGYTGSAVNGQCLCKQTIEDGDTSPKHEPQDGRDLSGLGILKEKHGLVGRWDINKIYICLHDNKCLHGTRGQWDGKECQCVPNTKDSALSTTSWHHDTGVKRAMQRPSDCSHLTHSCGPGHHYEYDYHFDLCRCKPNLQRRQDIEGCPNFSCPSGFIPKLNGSVCYCGQDGNFPYPQGPASLGPSAPNKFVGDSSS